MKHKHLKGRNRHHILNRCRGGGDEPQNLLLINIERHEAWYKLFRNLTLEEAIKLLLRVRKAKGNKNANNSNLLS